MKGVLEKICSGRFILTVICGGTFAWLSISGKLDAAASSAIILLVFKSYFERTDRAPESQAPPKQ